MTKIETINTIKAYMDRKEWIKAHKVMSQKDTQKELAWCDYCIEQFKKELEKQGVAVVIA